MTRRRCGVFALACALALLVLMTGPVAAAPSDQRVALPTLEPVTGGSGKPAVLTTSLDLASVGYVGEEYFLEGTATSYKPVGTLAKNGKWKVAPDADAPYVSRIVVYKPADAKDFNGTVFVEWLNITSGIETGPAWTTSHIEMIREGAAWVGVSAQAAGLQGTLSPGNLSTTPGGIKGGDPERYAKINHPGDAFSYDIFSQAGLAAAGKTQLDPLAGLKVKRVIGVGKSQSAFRMVTYANAIQPVTKVFDGLLVNSRAASAAGLGVSMSFGLGDPGMPPSARIRTDLDVPVFVVQSESDVAGLSSFASRQPDSEGVHTWEVAGTAHTDTYASGAGFGDTGDGSAEKTQLDATKATGGALRCASPINSGPGFQTLNAAIAHLERWVRDGTPPPKGRPFETTAGPTSRTGSPTAVIVRDEHGNAKGGVRTPFVDVPTAALTGNANPGSTFCGLFGTTTPFDAATIAALYPTHADYVKQFDVSTDKAVKAGAFLAPDAKKLKEAAAALPVGG